MEQKPIIRICSFIFLLSCLLWTTFGFAETTTLLPLDFKVRPHFPMGAFPTIPVTLNYQLVNNTNVTLPLSYSLDSPNFLQIGTTGNTCGNKIKPYSTCNLPVIFTLKLLQKKATLSPKLTIPGNLTINYGGRYPLVDDHIAMEIKSFGVLSVQVDTAPADAHLQYKALTVTNMSNGPSAIIGAPVIKSAVPNVPLPVTPCVPGVTQCAFQSTCPFGQFIQPGASCKIWFKSVDAAQAGQPIPIIVIPGTITIPTIGANFTFNAVYQNSLYATGVFSGTDLRAGFNNVAFYNGFGWNPLGPGLDAQSTGRAITIFKGDLYVGGNITQAGGVDVKNLAVWNGQTWSGTNANLDVTGTVQALQVVPASAINGSLFVGGLIANVGTTPAPLPVSNIAEWTGSSWQALGAGVTGTGGVQAFTVYNTTDLIVGGDLTGANGNAIPIANMAEWNGTTWEAPFNANGPNDDVLALTMLPSVGIYAGGQFTSPGSRFALWNGSWSGLQPAINDNVLGLATLGSNVFLGGAFTGVNPHLPINHIAGWSGQGFFPLATGFNNNVNAVATGVILTPAPHPMLFAGGTFTDVANQAGSTLLHVAQFDLSNVPANQWAPIAEGLEGNEVNSLFVGSSLDLN